MALQVLFAAIIFSLYSQLLWAEDLDLKKGHSFPEPELISVDHRVGKTAFVAVEPGRIPTTGFGIRTGYFITPDSLLAVNYSSGKLTTDDSDFEFSLIELIYKRFFTNSFYMDAGIAREKVLVDYEVVSSTNSSLHVKSQADIQRNGLVIHMGNQWQWSRFTIGCDWIGHHLPLVKEEAFKSNGNVAASEEDRKKKNIKNTVRSTLQLARIYLGISF